MGGVLVAWLAVLEVLRVDAARADRVDCAVHLLREMLNEVPHEQQDVFCVFPKRRPELLAPGGQQALLVRVQALADYGRFPEERSGDR